MLHIIHRISNTCSHKNLYMNAHRVIISQKVDKMWYIQYCSYLAIKRDDVLIHATKPMSLENTMQSEISQILYDAVSMKCRE